MADSEVRRGEIATEKNAGSHRPQRRVLSRVLFIIRRIHLYAGLFMLPWVFLYGITGAMYNHQGLLPEVSFQQIDASATTSTTLAEFPTADELARQITTAIDAVTPNKTITLADQHGSEFTNEVMFEVRQSGKRYAIHLDPIRHDAVVVTHKLNLEKHESLVPELNRITLDPDPHIVAKASVEPIMKLAGLQLEGEPRSLGWTKLNFLVNVDGEPARVTYVLRDGHVDIVKSTGFDGMTTRQYFMRLHTTHGQSPHWNGRSRWSLILDAMAIAMVAWGVTGVVMWWQIKRTRVFGVVIILLSIITALALFFDVHQFYATTTL